MSFALLHKPAAIVRYRYTLHGDTVARYTVAPLHRCVDRRMQPSRPFKPLFAVCVQNSLVCISTHFRFDSTAPNCFLRRPTIYHTHCTSFVDRLRCKLICAYAAMQTYTHTHYIHTRITHTLTHSFSLSLSLTHTLTQFFAPNMRWQKARQRFGSSRRHC